MRFSGSSALGLALAVTAGASYERLKLLNGVILGNLFLIWLLQDMMGSPTALKGFRRYAIPTLAHANSARGTKL